MMESLQENYHSESIPRSIAVVSGKGGSGKTMICAVLALVLDQLGYKVIIIDGDTGTAGMTYYLGLKLVSNIRLGLSNVSTRPANLKDRQFRERALQKIKGLKQAKFFGIGDHRRLEKETPEGQLPPLLRDVMINLRSNFAGEGLHWLVVDCRGGIDNESVAVCHEVDDIFLVVESDTTSFQATKHLVDVLSDQDLAHKIRGFLINKVFDDPTVIVRNGTAVFGSQFLAAIPFDLKATRAFLVGEIPSIDSAFAIHVWQGLESAYPEQIKPSPTRPWHFEEFREVGLTNLDSIRGGMVSASMTLLLGLVTLVRYFWYNHSADLTSIVIISYLVLVALMGSFEVTRRKLGSFVTLYIETLNKVLFKPEK